VGDEPYAEGWAAPLNAALYPAEDARRVQAPAQGCPVFRSKDTVRSRPDGDPASTLTVCPGEHRTGPGGSEVSVVWWSPDALALGAQASFGLRRDDLIVKDVPSATLRQHLDTHESWRASRAAALAAAAMPSIEVMTATEFAMAGMAGRQGSPYEIAEGTPDDVAVAIEDATAGTARPGGVRFGTLVHALLAAVPLTERHDTPGADLLARLAEAHGRVLGADAAEVAAAEEVVRRVLAHPLLRGAAEAAAGGRCYRETPVTWRAESGTLVEGYVDLAYVAGDEVVVVDFKTDRELEGATEPYRRQVQVYAAAIAAAMGKPARGVLMKI